MFIPSIVKLRQALTISITAENTSNTGGISAVNTSYAVPLFLGRSANKNPTDGFLSQTLEVDLLLSSGTVVTISRCTPGSSDAAGVTTTVSIEILEFYPSFIKSIQPFSISLVAGTASNTAAISAVTTGKSVIVYQGCKWTSLPDSGADAAAILQLTSSTVVTATRQETNRDIQYRGTVVEFR